MSSEYPEWVQKTIDCDEHIFEGSKSGGNWGGTCTKCGELGGASSLDWYLNVTVPISKKIAEDVLLKETND